MFSFFKKKSPVEKTEDDISVHASSGIAAETADTPTDANIETGTTNAKPEEEKTSWFARLKAGSQGHLPI